MWPSYDQNNSSLASQETEDFVGTPDIARLKFMLADWDYLTTIALGVARMYYIGK